MSINDYKNAHCLSRRLANDKQILRVAPYGEGMLSLSFFSGDFHCSNVVNKDEAREFAESILELVEEIPEPNPNQQALDFPQQEAT